ncbi:MAG: FAD-dependent oxidoreductase, partial [Holophagales bacterium]|nr:FAD-dependent oxidoreductase [Holophagales bacterium]
MKIPDLGGVDDVTVLEVLVAVGDGVEAEDPLLTLESDKASMDVPSPEAGVVKELRIAAGDGVEEGTVVVILESGAAGGATEPAEGPEAHAHPGDPPATAAASAAEIPGGAAEAPAGSAPRTTGMGDTTDADHTCQLVVLGSGPGGYTAAFRAADLGLDVVLVERYPSLGGVCLNVGCIPSKALLHVAKLLDDSADFAEHGITFGKPKIDLDRLRDWKDGVVGRLTGGIATMAKLRKVRVITGTGTLTGPHRMEIETESGKQVLAFEKAILAAGSQSVEIPGFPYGDERLVDSTGALELRQIPDRLLVIGGGIIGLEMATVYHALGSEITVVELLPGIMPGADRDLVRPLDKRLRKRYARILTETKV